MIFLVMSQALAQLASLGKQKMQGWQSSHRASHRAMLPYGLVGNRPHDWRDGRQHDEPADRLSGLMYGHPAGRIAGWQDVKKAMYLAIPPEGQLLLSVLKGKVCSSN